MFSTLDLLLSSTPLEGAEQMALDEILLGRVSRPLLRVYRWSSPCVTFGYFQRYNEVQALYPRRSLVRRWSGGGSVEHGDDFTFSLLLPTSEPSSREAPSLFYRALHEAIVRALQQHQIEARLATAEDRCLGASCFVAPSLCDVMLGRHKIAGGAQRRSKEGLLHQGSIVLKERGAAVEERELFLSLARELSTEVKLLQEEEGEEWLERVRALASERYSSVSWRERR
jgi:lipoate-protein ligase A